MIATLTGKLSALIPPQIVINVGGVGYEVDIPISHIAMLPPVGNEVMVYTHLVIREDAHLLFGFLSLQERNCFRQIIKISGIGPKIGLALLSTLNSEALQTAIDNQDATILCQTPGIGKKTAERMLLELQGKTLAQVNTMNGAGGLFKAAEQNTVRSDIANALESLGYNAKEITAIMKQLPQDLDDLNQGIKQALKLLSK